MTSWINKGIFWGWTKEVEPNECPGWGWRASVAHWNDRRSFVIAASCCRRWSVWVLDFSRSSAMFGSKRDLQLRRGSFWLLYFQHLNQAFSEWHWAHAMNDRSHEKVSFMFICTINRSNISVETLRMRFKNKEFVHVLVFNEDLDIWKLF